MPVHTSQIFLAGDTVRCKASFSDWDGIAADPDIVKWIIYDSDYTKIEEHTLSAANKLSAGVYAYDYTIPTSAIGKRFVYEFYGELGGKPSIDRDDFQVRFIKDK